MRRSQTKLDAAFLLLRLTDEEEATRGSGRVVTPRIRKIFAFANNRYAGHAPATVKLFNDLWNEKS